MLSDAPDIDGHVEIALKHHEDDSYEAVIAGDPEGLRSLANMLIWLADVNQEETGLPKGEREHIHLAPRLQLSGSSVNTELCRLDAKRTGEFPQDFLACDLAER